ncbi:MAG: Arc family DNA-binding protein [Intestinimonas sp.]|nr:Arc family DNA-binding protein [Intestinimonas sp.]MDY5339816.1 Arc family DNA-binding protein [Intestinimonas sp.]
MDEYKQITLRIKLNQYEEIKQLADKEFRSLNQQIEYMLTKFLEIKK